MDRIICGTILLYMFGLVYSDKKINVAFVIDDTGSMHEEIGQVKEKTQLMFNAVMNSKNSEVENFILITFNDGIPEPIKLRTITMDKNIFLTKLNEISVDGGWDCPELSMTGVKRAIQESKPNSYIYAFTDAAAKDYAMLNEVKSLAQNKSIQVNFLLTGDCGYVSSPNYIAYNTLAKATSGEVFHLLKQDIKEIINYIITSIESPKTILSTTPLKPGTNKIDFAVDKDMKDVTIAATAGSGSKVDLNITDPHGEEAPTKDIVKTKNSKVVSLSEPKAGTYKVIATSDSEGVATIKSSISIDFQYGFSVLKPTSLETTRTRPVSGENSHLSIKLEVKSDDKIKLERILILDLEDRELMNMAAETINEKDKFYVTSSFEPPNEMFKVVIIAVNQKTGDKIKRVGRTPVEPATMPGKVEHRRPVSIIKNGPKIFVNYNYPLQLECLVNAFPKPNIVWEDANGIVLSSKASTLELPYDYISVLDIDHVDKNSSYTCKVSNEYGMGNDSIEVHTFNPSVAPKIDVSELTKVVTEGTNVEISCRIIKGFPKPTISWEFKRNHASEFVNLPETEENLHLDPVNSDNAGVYKCRAVNTLGEDSHETELVVQIPPTVDVRQPNPIKIGDQVTLECKVNGNPEPEVRWLKDSTEIEANRKYNIFRDHTLRFVATLEDNGKYTCDARNDIGTASNTIDLDIYGPVRIESPKYIGPNLEPGSDVELSCEASGYPMPKITWIFFRYPPDYSPKNLHWTDRLIALNNIQRGNAGFYTCIADNGFDKKSITYEIDVKEYPKLNEPVDTLYIEENTSRAIECNVPRIESDKIRWYKDGNFIGDTELVLSDVKKSDSAMYSCRVSSALGLKATHVKVEVGSKPRFLNHKQNEVVVPYVYGRKITLECFVTGNPAPTITWWHNETKLPETSPVLHLKMYENELGNKRCDATNAFGTIRRTYVVKKTGCEINYNEIDLYRHHPLIMSTNGKFAEFENEKGVMIIPPRELIQFVCPNNVTKRVYCFEKQFIVRKQQRSRNIERHSYEDLKCTAELKPSTNESADNLLSDECSSQPGSKLVKVGYRTEDSFTGIYDVCYNTWNERQIFVKHSLNRYASNIEINNKTTFNDDNMRFDYDDMYDCSKQYHRHGKGCCFVGRQLVSPLDVLPGVQKSTYFNINAVPQWNFCGKSHNWNEVEGRVRDLAKSIKYKLQVYSGPHKSQREWWLNDGVGKYINVPMYLWKVVEIRSLYEAIAIITINIPNLTASDARSYVFCEDVCDRTVWMANTEWHNVERGYTFCCNIWEFIKKVPVKIIPNSMKYTLLLTKNLK